MTDRVKTGYSTLLMHVGEIEKPIRFYELPGFELINSDRRADRIGADTLRGRRGDVPEGGGAGGLSQPLRCCWLGAENCREE